MVGVEIEPEIDALLIGSLALSVSYGHKSYTGVNGLLALSYKVLGIGNAESREKRNIQVSYSQLPS